MAVLLLRLSGPMQSWGIQSRFPMRETGNEPSKSGVIGIVASALGRPRDANITDLAGMSMGIRADREGKVSRDFHTALNVITASGKRPDNAIISNRFYLADADFLVGFESGDDSLLQTIHQSLSNPRWPIFLGRKSFPLGQPVYIPDGVLTDVSLREALTSFPISKEYLANRERIRLVIEQDNLSGTPKMDQPVSFEPRSFTTRFVVTEWLQAIDANTGEE